MQYTQPLGSNFLGSEVGYIKNANVGVYKFGQGYYEADAGDTYSYKYTYGNGDYYTGKVYRDPLSTMYYPGLKINQDQRTGPATGYYEITGVSYAGVASSKYGQVYVTKYYDGDRTKKSFYPGGDATSAKGTNYLKSELGYIKNANVGVYQIRPGLLRSRRRRHLLLQIYLRQRRLLHRQGLRQSR